MPRPAVTLSVVPFSDDVAVTVRLKLPLACSGGVKVKPDNCAGVSVHVPSPLFVPADRLAPAGTPAIVMLSVSDPSVSTNAALMFSATAVSSVPLAVVTDSSGGVAVPLTLIPSGALTLSLVPFSVDVAVTVRLNAPLACAGGVKVRPDRSAAASVHVPSPLLIPAERVAPVGTPAMVMLSV